MAYAVTTRATLRTRVRERLLSTFWTDTEINLYINEALRVWNVLTGYQKNTEGVALTGGSVNFHAKTEFMTTGIIVQRIETSNIHLDPITLKELNHLSPTWYGQVASTTSNWMHVGLNNIALYKAPSSTFSATTYFIDTSPIPSLDGDYIQVGEEDMAAIIDYITFIAKIKESGKEFQESVALLQNFLKQASKYNAKVIQTSLYKKVMGLPFQQQQRPDALEHMPPK